jgi:hypothetical protein
MFEQFHVLLRPGEIRVTQRGGLLAGRGGRARAFAVPATRGGADEPWRASVQRLAEALTEMRVRSGALHVVVSDHFARHVLVPWSADLVADSERIAFARIAFGEVFGPAADAWTVTLDEQPAGRPSFACAIDRGLLLTVQDLAKALRLRLTSLAPALSDRINRHRRALSARTFCVASIEPGRLTLAFRHAGAWAGVRTRRVEGSVIDGLAGALVQEAAVSGVPAGGTLYLIGEDLGSQPAFGIPGWQVQRLSDGAAALAPAARLDAVAHPN